MRARNKLGLRPARRLRRRGGAVLLPRHRAPARSGSRRCSTTRAPVFTAIYAALFLGEAITARRWARSALTTRRRRAGHRGNARRPARSGFGPLAAGRASCRRCSRAPRSRPSARCARPTARGRSSPRSASAGAAIAAVPGARAAGCRPDARRVGAAGRGGRHVAWSAQLLMTHALRYVRAAVGGDHRAAHAGDVAGARVGAVRRPHRRARARRARR